MALLKSNRLAIGNVKVYRKLSQYSDPVQSLFYAKASSIKSEIS